MPKPSDLEYRDLETVPDVCPSCGQKIIKTNPYSVEHHSTPRHLPYTGSKGKKRRWQSPPCNPAAGIIGEREGWPHRDEAKNFYRCATCGQAVDKRDLGQVFHHEALAHEQLPLD